MTPPTPQVPRLNSLVQSLAEAYLENGQFAEAADNFSELVRNGLQTPNVYRNLARALLGMESFTEAAQKVYQHVLGLFPNERDLCMQMCKLLLKHKAHDPFAFKCYQQTLALNPPPERELLWALALHLQEIGYAPAAFEILKRLALRENGNVQKTLMYLVQCGKSLGKQNEVRNLLLYLEGRNERALGVLRLLALDYAHAFLSEDATLKFSPREWQVITQVLLSYERLESVGAAREYATLRLALAQRQSQTALRPQKKQAANEQTHLAELLQRLPQPSEGYPAEFAASIKHVYGMHLSNLAHISATLGETVARNLAQRFIAFATKYLSKAAHALCFPLADGFLAFSDSAYVLAAAALDMLHKIERYNLTAVKGTQLFVQTAVHTVEAKPHDTANTSLLVILELLHVLEAKRSAAELQPGTRNRLFFPAEVHARVPVIEILPARALGFLDSPSADFQVEVYEAVWRNPLEYVQEKTPYDLERFVVTTKLRGGRYFSTYGGRDRQLERKVVIKALSPHVSFKLAQDAELRDQVVATLRKIGRLEAQGLAAIYDMGFHEDIFFFAREYLEGKSLAEVLQSGRRFTLAESVNLTMRLCRILSAAHRQEIFHGNLKPANIWLFENDELKLSDFLVPGFAEKPDVTNHANPASWNYAAPELFHTFVPSAPSDIYALGVMLYELLAGKPPFSEMTSAAELEAAVLPPLSVQRPDLPLKLDVILARACESSFQQRYQTLFEFESALRTLLV